MTFTMIPQRAYVDFPRHTVKTSFGIRKYSIVRARAKEFGGIMQKGSSIAIKLVSSKFLGSTTLVVCTFVKILNSLAQRTS